VGVSSQRPDHRALNLAIVIVGGLALVATALPVLGLEVSGYRGSGAGQAASTESTRLAISPDLLPAALPFVLGAVAVVLLGSYAVVRPPRRWLHPLILALAIAGVVSITVATGQALPPVAISPSAHSVGHCDHDPYQGRGNVHCNALWVGPQLNDLNKRLQDRGFQPLGGGLVRPLTGMRIIQPALLMIGFFAAYAIARRRWGQLKAVLIVLATGTAVYAMLVLVSLRNLR
jgi:hypothetical protein